MKPVIGLMPLWDEEKESLWMLPGYMDGIRSVGGLPIMLPMTGDPQEIDQLCSLCDGFLFTGGHDVSSDIYSEAPIPGMVVACRARDDMELQILERAIQMDKPVLGICRGIQFINAALGGTLWQDIPTQHPSGIEHHMTAPYDRESHTVRICKDSPLYQLLRTEHLSVNSYHHQAIKDLSSRLTLMAEAEDGLIEALYMPGKRYVWAVQWHPEFSYMKDDHSRMIFRSFVVACSK